MNYIKNNKKIAAFMDDLNLQWIDPDYLIGNDYRITRILHSDDNTSTIWYNKGYSEAEVHNDEIETQEPKYHTSWDWLMPVADKINELGYEVLISRISCQTNLILDRDNPISSMVCGDVKKKIEITYEAIVQFIDWYNKNK
jgi:hypothetical protein